MHMYLYVKAKAMLLGSILVNSVQDAVPRDLKLCNFWIKNVIPRECNIV